jgi:hypothetical protein
MNRTKVIILLMLKAHPRQVLTLSWEFRKYLDPTMTDDWMRYTLLQLKEEMMVERCPPAWGREWWQLTEEGRRYLSNQ